MATPWHVHLAGGQKVKWALDEDLRWAQSALAQKAKFVSLPAARIVHAAWWPALAAIGAPALRGKTTVCFADNPPAFYLTQPEFPAAMNLVDLWIARSLEALAQFQSLGLRAELAPYCIDPEVFRPVTVERSQYGIPNDAYVIGNFHRDSEGADLARPKTQKGPDIFFQIARELHRRNPKTFVLLAGPRRHWLRGQLAQAGIPFRFVGEVMDTDDYTVNILDRPMLNRLYQLLDVCVISSRWEGGPYSALEAVFAGRRVISTPVGIARDVLPESCLYRSVDEAVSLLEGNISAPDREIAMRKNSLAALTERLLSIYAALPTGGVSLGENMRSAGGLILGKFSRSNNEPIPLPTVGPSLLPEETPLSASREALLRSAAGIAHARKS